MALIRHQGKTYQELRKEKSKKKIVELLHIAALKRLFSQCQKAVFLHSSFALSPTAVVVCDAKLTEDGG